ncbi:MAG TPA: hypothetical protein VFS40_06030 [Gemmatimonadales bacterium]|nr:hypothetical protein [Gemmatimonadales bacterium]
MPKSRPAAKPSAKSAAARAAAAKSAPSQGAPMESDPPKSAAKPRTRTARGKVQPRRMRLSESEIDLTPVRIVDDRRFSGKFQIVEDEGEKRVLGWGFPSIQAARRWIENRNHLSAWLRFVLRGEE